MLNKIISVILIWCLSFVPIIAMADDPILPPRGKITGLNYGQKAPYTGVLLNSIAAAKLLTDKRFSDEQWKLKLQYELAKESARLNLIIETQKVSYEFLQKKHKTLIDIKNNEIKRLSQIVFNTNDYSIWWASGGIVVGISLTIAVAYAIRTGIK